MAGIRIAFEYCEEDLVGAYRAAGGWGRHVVYSAGFFALAAAMCGSALKDEEYGLFVMAAVMCIIPVFIFHVGKEDFLRSARARLGASDHEMIFSPKGIEHRSGEETGFYSWSDFVVTRNAADVIFLQRKDASFELIPKRVFESKEALETVQALVEASGAG